LPIFFVVTKATRAVPPLAIWLVAAALESAHLSTGWTVIDAFCARFVYFYSGYLFAAKVFALSDYARARPGLAMAALALWAAVNAAFVHAEIAAWPIVSLLLGFAGACAIIVAGTLLARMQWLNLLRFCGEHSIVIYLAFFLPMAVTRTVLLRYGDFLDIGTISLLVNIAGVVGALAIWKVAQKAGAHFLFERPDAFWIAPRKKRRTLLAAE
jgi:uncharacterized membrane protein YcfT